MNNVSELRSLRQIALTIYRLKLAEYDWYLKTVFNHEQSAERHRDFHQGDFYVTKQD